MRPMLTPLRATRQPFAPVRGPREEDGVVTTDHACCAPGTGHDHGPAAIVLGAPRLTSGDAATLRAALTAEMVDIPGGEFVMGHDGPDGYASDGEGPAHVVALRPFRMMRTTVTNAQF